MPIQSTGSKPPEFYQKWMSKIETGLKARKKFSDIDNWSEYRAWYRGDFGPGQTRFLNITFSQGKSLIPRIYFKVPSVTVTPTRPEFAAQARILEAVDNWLIRSVLLKKTMKRSALDAYHCGTGVVKLGFDSEFGYLENQAVDRDSGTVTQYGRRTGRKIEYNMGVKEGTPWALRARPEDIVTPFGYDDADSLPWVCHMIIRPLEDVKEDQKYNNNRLQLKGGFVPSLVDSKKSLRRDRQFFQQDQEYCLLYEIRDWVNEKIIVLCEDKILMDEKDAIQVCGLPYEFIQFHEDPEYFWGISDVKVLMPHQIEINEIKQQAGRNRKYALLKFLYQRGAITQEALDALLSDDIEDAGAGIPIDSEALQSSVLPLIPHSLTAELEQDKQQCLSDVRESMGVSRNASGEMMPLTSKTATESEIVEQGVEVRMDERRDTVADVLTSVVRKWNMMIFNFWTKERIQEVAGPNGAKEWVRWTGDQIRGEYTLKIDPESAVPVSRAIKYKYSLELFKMFNQDPLIDQVGLRRMVLQQYTWMDPSAILLLKSPEFQPGGEGLEDGQIPPEMLGMPGAPPISQSSPNQPLDFEQFARMLRGQK